MTETASVPTIPTPLTPLIGRDVELAQLIEMLSGDVRLLTITGIGGIGKTRLATQIALELEPHFPDGAIMVPLAEQREQASIPAAIAAALGQQLPGIDLPSLVPMIGTGERLIVLDNLEQIPNAGDTIAALISACPTLSVLCTSQVLLDVPGEYVYPLQPMSVAAADATIHAVRTSPSVSLFLYRAHTANAQRRFGDEDIRIVAEICAMLDGIPLAIELAAARTSILTLPELRDRLGDRLNLLTGGSRQVPDRLRTMRNAIGWSYGLLDPDERRIFRYLGVYPGKLSIAAIEHTLASLDITAAPLDMIEFLVSRSLLRQMPDGGYQMLESLRAFAQEQLKTEGDADSSHLVLTNYIVTLAEAAEPHLTGSDQVEWYQRLGLEVNNFHNACIWAVANRPELSARIVAAAWRFLESQGLSETYVEIGRASLLAPISGSLAAHLEVGIGWMEEGRRRLDQSQDAFEHSLNYARLINDRLAEVRALTGLGTVAIDRSDMGTARAFLQQSSEIAKEIGDQRGQFVALSNTANVSAHMGENESARDQYLEAVAVAEDMQEHSALAMLYGNLGSVSNNMGDFEQARVYADRALELDRALNYNHNLPYSFMNLANAHTQLGNYDEAETYFQQALDVIESSHNHYLIADINIHLVNLHRKRQNPGEATRRVLAAVTHSSADANSRALISAATLMMVLANEADASDRSPAILGAVTAWREKLSLPAAGEFGEIEQRILSGISDVPSHSDRIGYSTGERWSLDELKVATIQRAELQLLKYPPAPEAHPDRTIEPPGTPRINLSPRELEVLAMVAEGHSNAEIAAAKFISMRTTTTHLTNIFTKLNVKNRSSAVAVARSAQLLPDG